MRSQRWGGPPRASRSVGPRSTVQGKGGSLRRRQWKGWLGKLKPLSRGICLLKANPGMPNWGLKSNGVKVVLMLEQGNGYCQQHGGGEGSLQVALMSLIPALAAAVAAASVVTTAMIVVEATVVEVVAAQPALQINSCNACRPATNPGHSRKL